MRQVLSDKVTKIGALTAVKKSRFGAVVRALAFYLCGPGSISAQCHMRLLLVLAFLRGFFSGFPTSSKTNTLNSSSTRIEDTHENQLWLPWLPL